MESLRLDLRTKEECIDILQMKLHDHDDLIRENEYLRIQHKSMEQKLERFTVEHSKKVDDHRRHEQESSEQIQSLLDEIERIKRDLVLEEYRKQEAERRVRYYDEKTKLEQNLHKKLQQDFNQMKQELKASHMKYDSLQIEMLAMHKANQNEISLLPSKDTDDSEWSAQQLSDPTHVRDRTGIDRSWRLSSRMNRRHWNGPNERHVIELNHRLAQPVIRARSDTNSQQKFLNSPMYVFPEWQVRERREFGLFVSTERRQRLFVQNEEKNGEIDECRSDRSSNISLLLIRSF